MGYEVNINRSRYWYSITDFGSSTKWEKDIDPTSIMRAKTLHIQYKQNNQMRHLNVERVWYNGDLSIYHILPVYLWSLTVWANQLGAFGYAQYPLHSTKDAPQLYIYPHYPQNRPLPLPILKRHALCYIANKSSTATEQQGCYEESRLWYRKEIVLKFHTLYAIPPFRKYEN